jgi:hypothetical protein
VSLSNLNNGAPVADLFKATVDESGDERMLLQLGRCIDQRVYWGMAKWFYKTKNAKKAIKWLHAEQPSRVGLKIVFEGRQDKNYWPKYGRIT